MGESSDCYILDLVNGKIIHARNLITSAKLMREERFFFSLSIFICLQNRSSTDMNENSKGMKFGGCFLLYPSAPSIRSKLEVKVPVVRDLCDLWR